MADEKLDEQAPPGVADDDILEQVEEEDANLAALWEFISSEEAPPNTVRGRGRGDACPAPSGVGLSGGRLGGPASVCEQLR